MHSLSQQRLISISEVALVVVLPLTDLALAVEVIYRRLFLVLQKRGCSLGSPLLAVKSAVHRSMLTPKPQLLQNNLLRADLHHFQMLSVIMGCRGLLKELWKKLL